MATNPVCCVTIPALALLASGVNENSAPTIEVGETMTSVNCNTSSLQHANQKRLAKTNPAFATNKKVVAFNTAKSAVDFV
jgi:hypothetical protein